MVNRTDIIRKTREDAFFGVPGSVRPLGGAAHIPNGWATQMFI